MKPLRARLVPAHVTDKALTLAECEGFDAARVYVSRRLRAMEAERWGTRCPRCGQTRCEEDCDG